MGGFAFRHRAGGVAVQVDSRRANLQRFPVPVDLAVAPQRSLDGDPVVAHRHQIPVDVDLERLGMLPVEAGGK